MAITSDQIDEISRILGYPAISPMASLQLEYPYFSSQFALWQPYATMLNRLAQASPSDEVVYLGAESSQFSNFFVPSSIAMTFMTPSSIATGVTVQANVGGIVETYQTQAGDTPSSVAAALATAIANDPNVNTMFMANAIGPTLTLYYIQGIGTDGNGVNCIVTSNDASLQVQIGSSALGQVSFGATSGGKNPPGPFYLSPEGQEPVYGYVPIIHVLESDLINTRENLDIKQAEEYLPRPDEMSQRWTLLQKYRKELADRISVPLDPDIIGNGQLVGQRIV